jgi:hypothetical protein
MIEHTSPAYSRFLALALDLYIAAGGPVDAFDPRASFHIDSHLDELVQLAIRRGHLARIGNACYFEEAGWRRAMAPVEEP